ncbi:hypothetical protein BMETH_795_1 [methanotrophic bacterial endosymbiont of Bathymodiolus sp.]|nr:hypothetical protein BMETH_795_1 [methanotrophic bacterial endosymbiont of Bathymodiolus sp.]
MYYCYGGNRGYNCVYIAINRCYCYVCIFLHSFLFLKLLDVTATFVFFFILFSSLSY